MLYIECTFWFGRVALNRLDSALIRCFLRLRARFDKDASSPIWGIDVINASSLADRTLAYNVHHDYTPSALGYLHSQHAIYTQTNIPTLLVKRCFRCQFRSLHGVYTLNSEFLITSIYRKNGLLCKIVEPTRCPR